MNWVSVGLCWGTYGILVCVVAGLCASGVTIAYTDANENPPEWCHRVATIAAVAALLITAAMIVLAVVGHSIGWRP